jgi:hypothetical protein
MDLGDLFLASLPLGGSGSRRDSSPAEQLSAAVGCGLFPIADFSLVLFAGGWRHGSMALWLPVVFTVLSVLLGRMLRVGTASTLQVALGCIFFCFLASGVAFLLAVFGSFFSGF